jgi:hypothetical protein
MGEIGISINSFRWKVSGLRRGFQDAPLYRIENIGMPDCFETTYPGAERALEILMRIERVMGTYHEVWIRDLDAIEAAAQSLVDAENELANTIDNSSNS